MDDATDLAAPGVSKALHPQRRPDQFLPFQPCDKEREPAALASFSLTSALSARACEAYLSHFAQRPHVGIASRPRQTPFSSSDQASCDSAPGEALSRYPGESLSRDHHWRYVHAAEQHCYRCRRRRRAKRTPVPEIIPSICAR